MAALPWAGCDGYSPIRAPAAPPVAREGLFQAIAAVGKGDVPRAGSQTPRAPLLISLFLYGADREAANDGAGRASRSALETPRARQERPSRYGTGPGKEFFIQRMMSLVGTREVQWRTANQMDLQIERTGDTKAYDGCRQYPSAIGQLIQVERLIAGHVQVGVYGGKINAVPSAYSPYH